MENCDTYIEILTQSLKKKGLVLDEIIDLNAEIKEIFSMEKPDEKKFNKAFDKRGRVAEKIERYDKGFSEVYARVKDEIVANKEKYRDEILLLKQLIKEITDKTVQISAEEERINSLIKTYFITQRKRIKNIRVSSSVAKTYYKKMAKLDAIVPQFMDKRK